MAKIWSFNFVFIIFPSLSPEKLRENGMSERKMTIWEESFLRILEFQFSGSLKKRKEVKRNGFWIVERNARVQECIFLNWWTLRLVILSVPGLSWTCPGQKFSLEKTPHKKLKFKNSRTGFGQKILLCKNDPKIQRIFCWNTVEIFCPGHVQDKPVADRIRTKSRVYPSI